MKDQSLGKPDQGGEGVIYDSCKTWAQRQKAYGGKQRSHKTLEKDLFHVYFKIGIPFVVKCNFWFVVGLWSLWATHWTIFGKKNIKILDNRTNKILEEKKIFNNEEESPVLRILCALTWNLTPLFSWSFGFLVQPFFKLIVIVCSLLSIFMSSVI